MRKHSFLFRNIALVALLLMSLMTSCRKEEYVDLTFDSKLEQPSMDPEAAKAYLSQEEYVYWESTDMIRVFPGNGGPSKDCNLDPLADPRRASFSAYAILSSDSYYAIYPQSFASTNFNTLIIPTSHVYRDDFSFGGTSWPMVAWCKDAEGIPYMDFHAVCGMARIQLTATSSATINSITFTEVGDQHAGYSTHPISGAFTIQNATKNAPHIVPSNPGVPGSEITIAEINQPVGPSNLLTFYLPLPATTAYNAATTNTTYAIRMTVHSSAGEEFTKDFAVKIRRNNITPVRAINIDAWGSNDVTYGISGCGTKERPFLIMNLNDLKKVKAAFDTPTPTLNGKVIDANTYFNISSSDITLDGTWTEGIRDFKGHLTYKGGNVTLQSIANNSQAPLFKSISAEGIVEDLTVRGTITYNGTADFSPFCGVNNGTIDRCRNYCQVTASLASVGGICVTNNGMIHNAANTQAIKTTANDKYAGGICITNNGTIDGYGTSIGKVTGAQAGTICHRNNGIVTNCQISLNRTDLTKPFGGLVYLNASAGSIKNSEILGMASSTSEIGGICYQNEGLIDQCKIGTDLLRGRGVVGGIAAYQRNSSSAEIRNCYNISVNTSNLEATTGKVGGIVGQVFTGKVRNCFCNMEVASANVENFGAIIGEITGGGVVENCYNGSRQARFCGLSNRNANLQANCFDITDDLNNVCIYNTTDGTIIRLTPGSNGSVGGLMIDALNDWVDANGSGTYLSWTAAAPASNVAPVFVTAGKKKTK